MLNCQLKATWSIRKEAESHTVTNKNGMRLPPGVSQLCHKRLLTCSVLALSVSSSQTSLKSSQIFRVGEACLLFSMAPNRLSFSETHQGQSLNLSINLDGRVCAWTSFFDLDLSGLASQDVSPMQLALKLNSWSLTRDSSLPMPAQQRCYNLIISFQPA